MYDLIITNFDLLGNSINHEVMSPEYSRNIPECLLKNIPRIFSEFFKVMKIFSSVKMFEKLVCGIYREILILAVSSLAMFF